MISFSSCVVRSKNFGMNRGCTFAKKYRPYRRVRRQLPIFPWGCPQSIVGAEELNFRVRDGNGCTLFAKVTSSPAHTGGSLDRVYITTVPHFCQHFFAEFFREFERSSFQRSPATATSSRRIESRRETLSRMETP